MTGCRWFSLHLSLFALLASAAVAAAEPVPAPEPRPAVFSKLAPVTVEDLRTIEDRVQSIIKEAQAATVGVRNGRAAGSGVIVSKDGYVLTAAHVCGEPGHDVTLMLPDGRRVKGKTLGMHRGVDAGLIKITEEGDWPVAEMAESTSIHVGDWCLATGHPGGFREDRPPVVRLGRVLLNRSGVIQTDCTLVGGDSGGPLFDMEGQVIGINSRIGASTDWNFHVPVSQFTDNWDRLVAGDDFGRGGIERRAVMGINGEDDEKGCRVTGVAEGLPADKAGLREGDIITTLEGKAVKGIGDLARRIGSKKPGDRVTIEILRDGETLEKELVLADPDE